MKRIYSMVLLLLCLLIVLSGCGKKDAKLTNNQESNVNVSYRDKLSIGEKNLNHVTIDSDNVIDISDVPALRDFVSHVFIAKVESIDGCSTTIGNGRFSPIPAEYGKMRVLKSIKGSVDGDSISYYRAGGVISIAEYEKDAPAEMIANEEKHRKESGNENIDKNTNFYEWKEDGDIDIEVGKTYIFFAMYNEETGYYNILGAQYGSREISSGEANDGNDKISMNALDKDELKLKNNDSGKYESLKEFIDKYFS